MRGAADGLGRDRRRAHPDGRVCAADCEFENAQHGGQFLLRYPDWFKNGIGARPSKGRKCFTTWNYFKKDSKLTPSGLIVPPTLAWREK